MFNLKIFTWIFRFKDDKIIDFLIENGAIVNHAVKPGQFPLHLAVWSGRVNVVESLINAGAHINATDGNLNTPLHYADEQDLEIYINYFNSTADDFYAIAVLLIDNGADVNAKNVDGKTPLEVIENEKSKFSTHLHTKWFKLTTN